MTSHIAYVIHAIFTLITTQGHCNITFSPYVFFFLCIWDRIILMFFTFFLHSSYIHVALLTLYRSGIKSI